MALELDLGGVEAWESGNILPAGTYTVKVTEAKEGTSSGGHPQLELQLEATVGPHEGGQIRDWITVIPKTAGKVKQVLEAFGVSNLDGKVTIDPSALAGKTANIIVREEPYEGKMKSKVKGYTPASVSVTAGVAAESKPDDADLPF